MGLFQILVASLLALLLVDPALATSYGNSLQGREDTKPTSYWFADIARKGKAVYAQDDYTVFRNVKDYGALGDGVADDSAAINAAALDGDRCFQNCDSETARPALVYFPPGTYLVKNSIVQPYYTQFVGDALDIPTLQADVNFNGTAVIDANLYVNENTTYWQNQNNFFRQVRNFIIDLTAMPPSKGAGIHWQVAQGTSLQNIVFNMNPDTSSNNQQKGVFIENGSGGFMAGLTFNGGGVGMDVGSQQFATRDLTFNNCNAAIHMIWDWVWVMQGLNINGGKIGINMTGYSSDSDNVGSLIVLDSHLSNVEVGISTLYDPNSLVSNGTLILHNVDMTDNVPTAIQHFKKQTKLLDGNAKIAGFVQGRVSVSGQSQGIQSPQEQVEIPAGLLDDDGNVFTRTKPQYEHVPAKNFVSVKAQGAMGDGSTDDTAAIQNILSSATEDQIVYFDHGAYLISDTIKIPNNIKITGEMWPLLMATGPKFADESKPKPVFEVGSAGEEGAVEMSDLIIETQGPAAGAILMQWNLKGSNNGAAGMWDVHFRVGGTAGTKLQSDTCRYNPNSTTTVDPKCQGAFMLLHLTQTASAYLENCWFWVADHELDIPKYDKLNIWNGRGVLIEATNPVWLWGTASEHSVLYNYQVASAQNVFIAMAQTETAYMQGNPDATQGTTYSAGFFDPDFATLCDVSQQPRCARTLGMRITNSSDVFMFGAGMYSFFDNYNTSCSGGAQDCQDHMISIEQSENIHLYGISTKASVSMLDIDGESVALDKDYRGTYCAAIAQVDVKKSGSPTNSSTALSPATTATTQMSSASVGHETGTAPSSMPPSMPSSMPSVTSSMVTSGLGSASSAGGHDRPASSDTCSSEVPATATTGSSQPSSGGPGSSAVTVTVTETVTATDEACSAPA
ncbi:glucan 1,3-beta-glucosidase GLUC78 precursor [Xylariaceae sp. FL1272]|nr:glucan 1,3-beta-glucosidase GLUC78 precursor [Xylariaceae sp. FL1272]